MIRPRGGDFLYSDDEFEIMKQDIEVCKKSECDGIVLGILTQNGSIDKERCKKLVDYAYPLGVTFHRAFDRTKDAFQSLEDIIEVGCERILTSGQHPKAIDGTELIRQLMLQADDRIIMMPGSGVNSQNIISIAESTGAVEFHSSASIQVKSNMQYHNELMNETTQHMMVNEKEVERMAALLKDLANTHAQT
jgi:copper homeostasis protein